jgi:hypothetical protein
MDQNLGTTSAPADPTANGQIVASSYVPMTSEAQAFYRQPHILAIITSRVGTPKAFYKLMVEANVPRLGTTSFTNKRVEPAVTEEVPAVTLADFQKFWKSWYVATDKRKGLRYESDADLTCQSGINNCHRTLPEMSWIITDKNQKVVLDEYKKPLREGVYLVVSGPNGPEKHAICNGCKKALREARKAAIIAGQKPAYVNFVTKSMANKAIEDMKRDQIRKANVAADAAKIVASAPRTQERPKFGRKDRGNRR